LNKDVLIKQKCDIKEVDVNIFCLEGVMKKSLIITSLLIANTFQYIYSTPSKHIWSPSTDIQPYKVLHLTADFYVPVSKNEDGSFTPPVTNFGLTVGILPFEKFQAEVGFDHIAGLGPLDEYPFYFNYKIGTPENSVFSFAPAVVFGQYAIGTKKDLTDYNIFYLKLAKTVYSIGKFSLGYYLGNEKLLVDGDGNVDNKGFLVAYERVMSEIFDKLWVFLDYQSGRNSYGSFSFGFSWMLSEKTSMIFGYTIYNNPNIKPTYTIQTDINF
jgi:hypothetical protein